MSRGGKQLYIGKNDRSKTCMNDYRYTIRQVQRKSVRKYATLQILYIVLVFFGIVGESYH